MDDLRAEEEHKFKFTAHLYRQATSHAIVYVYKPPIIEQGPLFPN
jgi:hypothetical protein